MKAGRLVLVVLLLSGLFGLSACGPTMKSSDIATVEDKRAARYTECVKARKDAETVRLTAIAKLSPEQTTMVMMGDAMSRQAEALSGRDQCGQGMNAFEMETAIARSRNEAIGNVGGKAITATGAGYAAYVAGDTIQGISKTSGDKTEIHGDGSSATIEKVTSNNDQKISTGDESSVGSTAAPNVSGPDKHTETAVAEPVVVAPATLERK